MSGMTELDQLLQAMNPKLLESEFVFCTVSGDLKEYLMLQPIATFHETEGLTLVVEKTVALQAGLLFEGSFRQITLSVHSSLNAVGLTAAVSTKLASKGISANMIAGFHHDHIFVQSKKAEIALKTLQELSIATR